MIGFRMLSLSRGVYQPPVRSLNLQAPLASGLCGLLLLVGTLPQRAPAQTPDRGPQRWADAIAAFAKQDAQAPQGGVVFVGSSSIRLWKLQEHFPGQPVINRGFGGSEVEDSLFYADQLVIRHRPRQVIVYAGDNDIARGKAPERVADDFRKLVARLHGALPRLRIAYIAIKPSLSRWALIDKMRQANRLIDAHCGQDLRLDFIDVEKPMLNAQGTPREDLFVKDGLHLNERGYQLWSQLVRAHVESGGDRSELAEFTAHQFRAKSGSVLPYRLLRPAKGLGDQPRPLVVFLHGAGERGDDNRAPLVHGMVHFASPPIRTEFPCYVIAPQCPENQQWVDVPWTLERHQMPAQPAPALVAVLELIDALLERERIDAKRVYITGLSMGGFGTWDAIQRHPERFAAAVPVCGGGDAALADRIKDIPLWAFHGAKDTAVKPSRSRDMIEALQRAGGKPRYTEYPDVGHNSWEPAYAHRPLYDWLFSQSR